MHNEKTIKNHIYDAAEKATPDVNRNIKADPRFKQAQKPSPFRKSPSLRVATTIFVVAIAFIVLLTNIERPIDAYSTVYVEINPLIEMDFDENDDLIAVRAHYSGDQLEHQMRKHKGTTYIESIELLIDYAIEAELLDENNPAILIDVDSKDLNKRDAMQGMIASRVPDFVAERVQGGYMIRGNQQNPSDEESARANAMNMGVMRYRLIQQLVEKTGEDAQTYADTPVDRLREKLEAQNIPVNIPSMTDRPGPPHSNGDNDKDDRDDDNDDHTPGPPDGIPGPGGRTP